MLALRERLRPHGDEGFSLLEAVIAITVAGVIFAGVGAATVSSVKAVLVGRTVQQASDVAEQAMESMRSLGYDAVSMKDSDLTVNEPLNLSAHLYDPIKNIVTGPGVEQLV